jgi:hypothetical protein
VSTVVLSLIRLPHFQYHRILFIFVAGIIEKSYDIVDSQILIYT